MSPINYTANVHQGVQEFGYDPDGKAWVELSENITMTMTFDDEDNANVQFYCNGKEIKKQSLNKNQLQFVDNFMDNYKQLCTCH